MKQNLDLGTIVAKKILRMFLLPMKYIRGKITNSEFVFFSLIE